MWKSHYECDRFLSEMYLRACIYMFYLMPNMRAYISTYSRERSLLWTWHRCNRWHPTARADHSCGCVSLKLQTNANIHPSLPPPPSPVHCVCYNANTLRFLLINRRSVATSRCTFYMFPNSLLVWVLSKGLSIMGTLACTAALCNCT